MVTNWFFVSYYSLEESKSISKKKLDGNTIVLKALTKTQ